MSAPVPLAAHAGQRLHNVPGAAASPHQPLDSGDSCPRPRAPGADRLQLEAGDRVLAIETDRGILLTPYDPEVERALAVAAKAAKKYRNALRELAK